MSSQTASRIAAAEAEAAEWQPSVLRVVVAHNPRPDRWTSFWWTVTVAWARKPDESPVEAAQRLQQYVLAYRERNGHTPPRSAL